MEFQKYTSIGNLCEKSPIFLFKRVIGREKIDGQNVRILIHGSEIPDGQDRESYTDEQDRESYVVSTDTEPMIVLGSRKRTINTDTPGKSDQLFMEALECLKENGILDKMIKYQKEITAPVEFFFEQYGSKIMKRIKYVPDNTKRMALIDAKILFPGGTQWMSCDALDRVAQTIGCFVAPRMFDGDPSGLTQELLEGIKSLTASMNGVEEEQPIEGLVLVPPVPMFDMHGGRVISKFKTTAFEEISHKKHDQKEKNADAVKANEFVERVITGNRIHNIKSHDLGKYRNHMKDMQHLIPEMIEDVKKECSEEYERLIQETSVKTVHGAIKRKTAKLYKLLIGQI